MAARRLRVVAVTLVAASLVAGCGLRTFEGRVDGNGMAVALPVTVDDRTGLVTGVASLGQDAGGWADSVTNPFGRQDQLIVNWTGGACDRHATLLVEPSDDEFVIRISTERAEACRLDGIARSVRLELSGPVEAERVHLRIDT